MNSRVSITALENKTKENHAINPHQDELLADSGDEVEEVVDDLDMLTPASLISIQDIRWKTGKYSLKYQVKTGCKQ